MFRLAVVVVLMTSQLMPIGALMESTCMRVCCSIEYSP